MNMPLHQISVIPRDVTSSRVSGGGKAKDKQVGSELCLSSLSSVFTDPSVMCEVDQSTARSLGDLDQ
ncbi:hypothetical protein NHX12_022504 [Muraenolepis orangiensis]|uniref:Uncharacterized protein n=1 Tax=Muraenolepis orangiensis TaxID=630683 RepID=A0A9Q0ETN4_9TELE|nr:hypothetical protein NHX12_022504 [Muraenolepis orangiensis]